MDPTWFINGKFAKKSEATIPANDSALMRGCGFFEYARTYEKIPLLLDQHINRLFFSASFFGISIEYTRDEIASIVHDLIDKNPFPNAGIKMLVSGGPVLDLVPQEKSSLYIYLSPFAPFPEAHYEKGIRVKTANTTRAFPICKTTFYLPGIMARKQAHAAGFDEAAYVNDAGHILECPTSNLFFFREGAWHTPKNGVLPGLTREIVMEIANDPVVERDIALSELPTFTEVITTSTNREVMPIAAIDAHTYAITEKTRTLIKQFNEFITAQTDEKTPFHAPTLNSHS